MANPASPGSELQKSTKHILQIVRGANGAVDTVFPALFGLSSKETQVGARLPNIGIRPDEKICNPENLRQNIVSVASELANPSIRVERRPGL